MSDGYLWLKALHIISVIFWMAGLFMLPRFFAYHAEAAVGSPEDRHWQEREMRLLRIVMNPAMIATWVFGLTIAVMGGWFTDQGWLHAKLVFVVALTGLHMVLARWRKTFVAGKNMRSSRFYRLINEVPTLTTIVIVILASVKPF
ncbi:MAG: protoporphyrinogen oxidase HemJ [Rhodothalassiaceae bacterium]